MFTIKPAINKFYQDKPQKKYDNKMLSPSMIGGCARVMYYTLMGVEQTTPPDVNAQLNFEVGNLWEAKISEILDNMGQLVYWWIDSQSEKMSPNQEKWKGELRTDKWIDEELRVAGTPDNVITDNEGNYVLADTKTMKANSASYIIKKTDAEYFQEKEGYMFQLATYLLLAKRRYEKGLEKYPIKYGKLIIISKDTGAIIKEPVMELTPELEELIMTRIKYLLSFIDSNTLPPCECGKTAKDAWMVHYCNYGDVDSIAPNKQGKPVPHVCCNIKHEHIN